MCAEFECGELDFLALELSLRVSLEFGELTIQIECDVGNEIRIEV